MEFVVLGIAFFSALSFMAAGLSFSGYGKRGAGCCGRRRTETAERGRDGA